MSFHEKLRLFRLQNGLTQQAVADKLAVDKTTYSGYETGKRQPDIQKIRSLAKILDVSLDTLFETEKDANTEEEFILMGKGNGEQDYICLTQEEYEVTKAMVRALRKRSCEPKKEDI